MVSGQDILKIKGNSWIFIFLVSKKTKKKWKIQTKSVKCWSPELKAGPKKNARSPRKISQNLGLKNTEQRKNNYFFHWIFPVFPVDFGPSRDTRFARGVAARDQLGSCWGNLRFRFGFRFPVRFAAFLYTKKKRMYPTRVMAEFVQKDNTRTTPTIIERT